MSDSVSALKAARVEVARCQRNIDRGGPPAFWMQRLLDAAKRYEAAAAMLRMQVKAIVTAHPSTSKGAP